MSAHILNNPLRQLDAVIEKMVSRIHNYTKSPTDFTRKRKLDASTLIKVTLNMEGQSLNTEMIHAFPDMESRATASAYEQQKSKLTPQLFRDLLIEYNKTNTEHHLLDNKYRVYAIDGSDFNIPYQSKSKYVVDVSYGRPCKNAEPIKPHCQLHGNILFNLMDRTYEDIVIQPRMQFDERSAAISMLQNLHSYQPYIVIMDRGYESFNMIEHCNRLDNGYYIIRIRTGNGGIKEIANLPDKECDVDMSFRVTTSGRYYELYKDTENIHLISSPKRHYKATLSKNTYQTKWDFKQFETVKCRVCKFRINDPSTDKEEWEVLVTNLNRFEFPISRMKKMYHMRWDIETSFRELKYALGAIQFHSRKDDFVEMELYAHLTMFNVVSRNINQVTIHQPSTKKYKYVVSFKDAVTIVRKYFKLFNTVPSEKIYAELLSYTRPVIPGRSDKRKVKSKSAVWFVYRVA